MWHFLGTPQYSECIACLGRAHAVAVLVKTDWVLPHQSELTSALAQAQPKAKPEVQRRSWRVKRYPFPKRQGSHPQVILDPGQHPKQSSWQVRSKAEAAS